MWVYTTFYSLLFAIIVSGQDNRRDECLQPNESFNEDELISHDYYLLLSITECGDETGCFTGLLKQTESGEYLFAKKKGSRFLSARKCTKSKSGNSLFTCTGKNDNSTLNVVEMTDEYHVEYVFDNGSEKLDVYAKRSDINIRKVYRMVGDCVKSFDDYLFECNPEKECSNVDLENPRKRKGKNAKKGGKKVTQKKAQKKHS